MSEVIRDIHKERMDKFHAFNTDDYTMDRHGVIRRKVPKTYRNKAERKALKRLKIDELSQA
jgi:hypothetical protein